MPKAFQLSGSDRSIEFSDSAWQTFGSYAQRQLADHEAGGVLLGRIIENTGDCVVDEATAPNKRDHRSRFRFRRSRAGSQPLVDGAWTQSAGTRVYLGEWHTHPEDDPSPSCVDRADRIRLLVRTKCEQDRLIFVIVGRALVRVWDGKRSTLIVRELGAVPLDS